MLATGIAFSVFGLGGLGLRLIYFPLLSVFVRDRAKATRWARLAVHYSFKCFIELMRILGILSYQIQGLERLDRPGLLILANHPTLIDVVFLISLVRNANCVVKASLARNMFTSGPVVTSDYICNDSGVGLVEDCIESVRGGDNLIIFPEGTRTPVQGARYLQRGAANIAVRGLCVITPVTICCEPLSLTKGLPWWKVPATRMHFTITVHEDLPVQGFLDQADGEPALAARKLTRYLHDFFDSETKLHART